MAELLYQKNEVSGPEPFAFPTSDALSSLFFCILQALPAGSRDLSIKTGQGANIRAHLAQPTSKYQEATVLISIGC
jgi:hypothetical protein